MNVAIDEGKWTLASLPIRNGIRRVRDIGIPSFLSSIFGVSDLIYATQPTSQIDLSDIAYYGETLAEWNELCPNASFPTDPSSQQQWDSVNIKRISSNFTFTTDADAARYLASFHKETGAWLTVLPSKNIGTLLDNNAFRISMGLRLGCDLCYEYRCVCGAFVDKSGVHGLSCEKSAISRFNRHYNLNDTIKRGFNSAEHPARLEPEGLCRSDGKRPDGMTLVPWSNGQLLVWDATCVDTLAPSYIKQSSRKSGSLAKLAANRKRNHYRELIEQNYLFIPFVFETLGPWCDEALDVVRTLGSRIARCTGEPKSGLYLMQKISIIIQRLNAACIMSSLPSTEKLNEVFLLL